MDAAAFETESGVSVTAVTAEEMRSVDRVAVDDVGLTLVRMMEHAGRALANHVLEMLWPASTDPVVILAGSGGNGGGGSVCARHLANRSVPVVVVTDRDPEAVTGVPGEQLRICRSMGIPIVNGGVDDPPTASLVVDALVGYGLADAPYGRIAELITWTETVSVPTVSLDVRSGLNATTGATPGVAVSPDRTVTLALPKTGLTAGGGDLVVADLSIPETVYDRLEIPYEPPFGTGFSTSLAVGTD